MKMSVYVLFCTSEELTECLFENEMSVSIYPISTIFRTVSNSDDIKDLLK